MSQTSYLTLAITVTYVILIGLFLVYEKDSYSESDEFDDCNFPAPCVNICPGSEVSGANYSEIILKNFPNNGFSDDESLNSAQYVSHLVSCSSLENIKILNKDDDWNFNTDGGIDWMEGYAYDINYQPSKYCLSSINGEWSTHLCVVDHSFVKFLHYLLIFMETSFLIIPLAIYASYAELRDSNGKMCIALLISQIYILAIIPLVGIDELISHTTKFFFMLLIYTAAFSSNFIVNAMCFDIYLTFKHFREPNYHSKYFRIILWILGTFLILIALVLCFEEMNHLDFVVFLITLIFIGYFLFFGLIMLDIFVLIAALFNMAQLALSSDRSENTRFDLERERYWTYVKLFVVLAVMWTIEMMSWTMLKSHESELMADLIKVFSTAIIAYILVWKPKVYHLLFQKYKSFSDEEESNDA